MVNIKRMMFAPNVNPDGCIEYSRLASLLPAGWDKKILICVSPASKNWLGKYTQSLIAASKKNGDDFVISIDFRRWQYFDEDARNMLWWHELALIQQHSIKNHRSTVVTGAIGLALAASQVVTQDLVMLSIGLTIAGLAGFQFYQNRRGERYIRQITQADQGAISIARQFGYSTSSASATLHSALKILAVQATGQAVKVYRTRLQVLDICDNLNVLISASQINHSHENANIEDKIKSTAV
jgi:Protein of unknown function (DUF3318)